jgi:3-phenylpropionate/trans-cinnamate dioxygenase ferredoxin subunit
MRRIDLIGTDEIADGEMRMVWVDGTDQVLVINQSGDYTAVQGVCSHEYFELDKGFLTNGTLTCALHLSRFDLSDGEPLDPPAEEPLAVYPVVVEDGVLAAPVHDAGSRVSVATVAALMAAGVNGSGSVRPARHGSIWSV